MKIQVEKNIIKKLHTKSTGIKIENRNNINNKENISAKNTASPNHDNFIANFLINSNNITFCGKKRIDRKHFMFAQCQDKISCPCCGEKMHTYNKAKAKKLAKQIGVLKGENLSEALGKNIYEFQASKKGLVVKIIELALKFPDKNVSELLEVLSSQYMPSLKMKQINILSDLTNQIPHLNIEKEQKFDTWRLKQIERIMAAEKEGDFKNKLLTASFFSKIDEWGIDIDKERMRRYFERLPNSKLDADAFVIKYMRRQPQETVLKLIKNVEPTIEHIIPFSESHNNKIENLLVMCADCNSARGSIPYKEFMALHPEMIINTDKYLDDIRKILDEKNGLPDWVKDEYTDYIKNVKTTLKNYSGKTFKKGN